MCSKSVQNESGTKCYKGFINEYLDNPLMCMLPPLNSEHFGL